MFYLDDADDEVDYIVSSLSKSPTPSLRSAHTIPSNSFSTSSTAVKKVSLQAKPVVAD